MKRLLLLFVPLWLIGIFPSEGLSQSGQALKMTQSDQSAYTPTPVTSPYNITMEAWIKPLSLSGPQNLFYVGNGSTSGCGIYLVDNQIIFLAGGVIATPTGVFLEPGKWVHIAFVKDGGGAAYLFVDGNYVAATYSFYPHSIYSDEQLLVGGFVGWIDNFRFWTVARSNGQIILDMDREFPLESNQLSRNYLFEETPGTACFDEVAQMNSMILQNGAIQDLPDVVSTSFADQITSNGARLHGTVFAKADPTLARVLISGNYFEATDSSEVTQNPLAGSSYHLVSADLTGLSPDTWYSYKITAAGDSGYFSGKPRRFLTLVSEPTEPAFQFSATEIKPTSATLSWKNGNGDNVLVVISESDVEESPVDGTVYYPNPDFSKAPVLSESSRIVYSGTDTLVQVTGLSETTTYYFWVYSFNSGSYSNPSYLTPEMVPGEFQTPKPPFSSLLIENLGYDQAKVQFADIDKDGRMDFAVLDRTLRLYWNNGEGGYDIWWESEFNCYGEGSINWFYESEFGFPSLAFFSGNSSGILQMGEGWYTTHVGEWPVSDNFISTVIDYNRDGLMDLLVSRDNHSVIQIFKNLGNGNFAILDTNIPFLIHGNFAVGDFNQDGYPDVAYSGSQNDYVTRKAGILWNQAGTEFTDGNLGWPGAHRSDVATADFNQDGWLDVLYTGSTGDGGRMTALYLNNQEGGFYVQDPNLPAMAAVGISIADFNGDGYPDVVMSGTVGGSNALQTSLALNDGEGNFTVDTGCELPPLYFSSVSTGDADHDGDVDVLISGYSNLNENYQLYLITNNGLLGLGQKPEIPTELNAEVNGNEVTLNWMAPFDPDATTFKYDIRLGSYEAGSDIIPPASDDTGFVRIPALLTSGPDAKMLVKRLPQGTYYWNVQAVDATLLGSGWSFSGTFEITTELPPAAPDGLTAKFNGESILLNWYPVTNESFSYYTIYAGLTAESLDSIGFIDIQYPDLLEFSFSTFEFGKTYYFAVSQTLSTLIKSDLSQVVAFTVSPFVTKTILEMSHYIGNLAVGDLNHDGRLDLVCSPNNYESYGSVLVQLEDGSFGSYAELSHYSADAAIADINGDGIQDIVSIGDGLLIFLGTDILEMPFDKIYLDESSYYGYPEVNVADADNDGDLDIFVISGDTSFVAINFSMGSELVFEHAKLPLGGLDHGSIDFADMDKDGDVDLLVTGYPSFGGEKVVKMARPDAGRLTAVLINQGPATGFEMFPAAFNGVSRGAAVWGDYNNDSYPDILVNGSGGNETRVLSLYRNNAGEDFTEVDIPSGGLAKGSIKWADFNKDGLLDYAYFGCSLGDNYRGMRVAFQNGDGSFSLQDTTQFDEVNEGDLITADIDGDFDQDILVLGNFYPNDGGLGTITTSSATKPKTEPALNGSFLVIYENKSPATNTQPSTPEGLTVTTDQSSASIEWNAATDAETPSAGLTYNLLIVPKPMAGLHKNSDSEMMWPLVTRFGYSPTFWNLQNLPDGDYFAQVQSVDPGLVPSTFTEPVLFTINNTVPVELSSFTGSCLKGNITLRWETVTETNNAGFEIQKLKTKKGEGGIDQTEWERIGFVDGKGTTTEPQKYVFLSSFTGHPSPILFRLKQIDVNGKETFSPTIEVQPDKPLEFTLGQNYPNPFNPSTTIPYSVASTGKVKIVLIDLLGRQVKTLLNEDQEAGFYDLQFSTDGLSSGIYFYKMEAGKFTSIKKLTILK